MSLVKSRSPTKPYSGQRFHPALIKTSKQTDIVNGTIYLITEQELAQADTYEVDDYQRIAETFQCNKQAWLYVAKNSL